MEEQPPLQFICAGVLYFKTSIMYTVTFSVKIQMDIASEHGALEQIKETIELINLDFQRAGYNSTPQIIEGSQNILSIEKSTL